MQNHGSRIPFSPISVVVTGKLHYRLYFEIDDQFGTNQKAFEFLVDEASGIVTWQPAFEAAMGGDLSSSRHLVDCVSALDRALGPFFSRFLVSSCRFSRQNRLLYEAMT